ncbi:hypothetical protein [Tenacibaculum ovolyticum]|uniref:hypothetical protein n=1 Tax=Tenacibaculum ovolyticum TaxID=104270 RepID=UPI0004107282|nr:hypothetical protein [Tenacibaculum ovolyticum]
MTTVNYELYKRGYPIDDGKIVFYDANDSFYSIGAGRGTSPETIDGDGNIKCDSFFSIGTRELENNNNTYFYI